MQRENFSTNMAAVMAMAGSAIGLGNIWRFPYMAGQNGGGAFVLIYFLCMVLLSMPIFFAESLIGRCSGANTFGAMKKLAPGTAWKWVGLLTVLTPLIIFSYYSVVGGWSIEYLAESVTSGFGDGASELFLQFTSSVWGPVICHTAFIAITAFIVFLGVKSGIERFNRISLPVLFVLIVSIAVYSMTLPGAMEGVTYLLKPDFSAFNMKTFAYAMGQGFFSLSLGVGTVLTFSSYMKKGDSIMQTGIGAGLFDFLFAMLAGLAIMPAVFSAGIEPGVGPGLIFETLPYIFARMADTMPLLSRLASILFFVTIVVAALTSSISMLEVGVSYCVEEHGLSRGKSVLVLSLGAWALGVLCSLSFGPLAGVKIFDLTIFSFCDILTSNFLISFGALLFVLFVGWKMDRKTVMDELTNGGSLKIASRCAGAAYFMIRYVAPVAVVIIFLTNFLL